MTASAPAASHTLRGNAPRTPAGGPPRAMRSLGGRGGFAPGGGLPATGGKTPPPVPWGGGGAPPQRGAAPQVDPPPPDDGERPRREPHAAGERPAHPGGGTVAVNA